ncbi:MAG: pyridoxal-phosphate dependent enzyme [Saprospiraceae bacterium]|jgi:threonine synthase|nr:pyridoxal-phosphate dependent enzyme [Saprospiraceae bacterium]
MNIYKHLTPNFNIQCVSCGTEHTIEESQSFCLSCGHGFPLEIIYGASIPFDQLPYFLIDMPENRPSSLQKLDFFSKKYNAHIYAKCESELPTGSFKHRGSVVEVITAKQFGYDTIVCASTGNMGASLAALCAKFGMTLILFVPKNTPAAKLAAARKFGAQMHYVDGAYSVCEREASEFAKKSKAFLAGDYYLRVEGAKLVAGELLMQLENKVPDMVLVPGGVGTNASAIAKGFVDLASGGLIDRVPQLVVVQSEKCSPIIDSLTAGRKIAAHTTDTLCSATAVADPYDFIKVKKYVEITDGFGVKVTDEASLIASKQLAEIESIDAELSGAMPLAALDNIKDKIVDKTIVLFITGAGYKDIHVQEEAYAKLTRN